MYIFHIKENGPDADIVVTRAMLFIAAIACYVYRMDASIFINIIAAIILLAAALFVKLILVKYRLNKLLLLSLAAVILFVATHSVAFSVILLLYGFVVKYAFKKGKILVSNEGVSIQKFLSDPLHSWSKLNNVVMKDGILTIDFKNNKLLQLAVDENIDEVKQQAFNNFCSNLIIPGS